MLPAAKGAVRKKKVAEVLERRCNGSTVEVRRYVKDVYVLCYGDWSPTDARFFGVDIDIWKLAAIPQTLASKMDAIEAEYL